MIERQVINLAFVDTFGGAKQGFHHVATIASPKSVTMRIISKDKWGQVDNVVSFLLLTD